jgi:predicted anti-sigma-YlaC factor YlaD
MERHNNTKCETIREQFLDLADPAAKVPAEVNEHLQQCTVCAVELDSLRRTWNALDEWQAPEPSPYFDSRMRARLREEKAAPERSGILAWLGVRWQPALAATLALALVVAISVFRLTGSQPQIAQQPPVVTSPAVYDLQDLDKNADVYNNFDMLYDDDQQTSDQ